RHSSAKRKIEVNTTEIEQKLMNIPDASIFEICQNFFINDPEPVAQSLKTMKKVLLEIRNGSNELTSRVYDIIVQTNSVARLLLLLQGNISEEAKTNIFFILIDVSCGDASQVNALFKANAVDLILPFLADPTLCQEALFLLSNLAADNSRNRDIVFSKTRDLLRTGLGNMVVSPPPNLLSLILNFCSNAPPINISLFSEFINFMFEIVRGNDSKSITLVLQGFYGLIQSDEYFKYLLNPLLPVILKTVSSSNEELFTQTMFLATLIAEHSSETCGLLVSSGFVGAVSKMLAIHKLTVDVAQFFRTILKGSDQTFAISFMGTELWKDIVAAIQEEHDKRTVLECGVLVVETILSVDNDKAARYVDDHMVFDGLSRLLTFVFDGGDVLVDLLLRFVEKVISIGDESRRMNSGNNWCIDMLEESNCLGLIEGLLDRNDLSVETGEKLEEIVELLCSDKSDDQD
ncbi:hypothetical protein EIN_387950, partial [Entamoeba invadens IP1]